MKLLRSPVLIRLVMAGFVCAQSAFATSWGLPKFPEQPAPDAVLEANGLARADQTELLRYVLNNQSSMAGWIPQITEREQLELANEYLRRLDAADPTAPDFWKEKTAELTKQRLRDPRRIVDAALRRLGTSGTVRTVDGLLSAARYAEPPWAQWKALASVQEILTREDPAGATYEELRSVESKIVAPLLRDLPPEKAEVWALALWENAHQPASPNFRSHVPLPARFWLARFIAKRTPQVAAATFRDGLRSRDAAVRTLAEMLLRECLGGSLPHGMEGDALVKRLEGGDGKPARALWDVFPKPLDRPLVLTNGHGAASRADLIWIDAGARITRRENDVWPMVREVLPNGLFYSRVGDHFRMSYALTGSDGAVHARFNDLDGGVALASHGGLWCQAGENGHATEFAPDGTVLWQCPLAPFSIRAVAPYLPGRVLCLGYKFLQCRNRRGDVLWSLDLEKLDDPREVLAIGEEKFLLSCGKSVGELSEAGEYKPLVDKLGSALWIRYHPSSDWIIFDGANWQALTYNAATGQVTGRLDLDDDGEFAKSKFAPGAHAFPE